MDMGNQKGFSLLELLVVVATIAILTAIAIPLMRDAILRAHISAAATDAKAIYVAFKRHHMDTNMYPYASTAPAFQLDTFEPLISMGYYDGRLTTRLVDQQADAYDSPDDNGVNQEFWLEVSLAYDPTVRFLISDSDDAPLAGGEYMDGIFLYRKGVLTPL
jgi:prepilin-type N-terminal cleavage/methylation domain-containing protein